jgi:DNA-binding NtrC family response regulator
MSLGTNTETDSGQGAEWLRSPLSDLKEKLHPLRDIRIQTFSGAKKKMRLFRTQYSIGREAVNDISLDDPFVCSRHAEVFVKQEGKGYWVRDLGSRNGVFLNGLKVQEAPLPRVGELRCGRSRIVWEDPQSVFNSSDWLTQDENLLNTLAQAKNFALSGLPILLLGESGTGKEGLARMIHGWSRRANGPYVPYNGALAGGSLAESELFGHRKGAFTGAESPRLGALKSAHHGTLFLDEVADIPLSAQVKLLRALDQGEIRSLGSDQAERVDIRIVAATSQSLEEKVKRGEFRLDLFYRLSGAIVRISPLRERTKDILFITKRILEEKAFSLSEESESILLSHPWYGNVRELKSAIERAVLCARTESQNRILPSHLAGLSSINVRASEEPSATLEEIEKAAVYQALIRSGWSRSVAAKELGIARSTLFEKMRRYRFRDKAEGSPSLDRAH